MDTALAELLVCPACSGNFTPGDDATCMECGQSYPVADGIVSLTSEGAYTKLDEIDYDAVYRVDSEGSHAIVSSCLRLLGDRMPRSVDSFLEIGAGTGQFTLGFLQQVPTRTSVITDISPSMLRNCRRRLIDNGIDGDAVHYVTWDGARCWRPGGFQLIAGFSVLHHVLDFESMLAALSGALRNDGVALFLEPNYRFHVALVDTLCEIYLAVLDDPQWTTNDHSALSSWLTENNINLRFRGDDTVLAGREDKHLFDGGQLELAASAAGFGRVELVPFGGRSECFIALKVYSNQFGLRDEARNDLLARFSRLLPGNFAHLAEEDLAPSTLIVLYRGGATGVRAKTASEALRGEIAPKFAHDISLSIAREGDNWTLEARGWVLGDTDVTYLVVDLGDGVRRFPVQTLRTDVDAALNQLRTYPLRRSLFCGVAGAAQPISDPGAACTARLAVISADDEEFALAEVRFSTTPGTTNSPRLEAA